MLRTKSAAELWNKHADAPRYLPLREDSLLQNWLCRSLVQWEELDKFSITIKVSSYRANERPDLYNIKLCSWES